MYDLEKQIKVGKTLRKGLMIDYEVPKLSLSGLWLQKAGFSIGDYAELLIRRDLIVVTPIESFKANKQELTKNDMAMGIRKIYAP